MTWTVEWAKVVTDPLGLAGFALALVFSLVGRFVVKKRSINANWLIPAAYALAVVCVIGGLFLAQNRQAASNVPSRKSDPGPQQPSMQIQHIQQDVSNGSAVAGVQGNVTIKGAKPKK